MKINCTKLLIAKFKGLKFYLCLSLRNKEGIPQRCLQDAGRHCPFMTLPSLDDQQFIYTFDKDLELIYYKKEEL